MDLFRVDFHIFLLASEPADPISVRLSMKIDLLNKKFERIGARLKVNRRPQRRRRQFRDSLSLDIGSDRKGEFFEVRPSDSHETEVQILDVRPAARHLLLMARENDVKSKFLCGHDERHWFVAAIPENAPVGTVQQAMTALQPSEVRSAVARKRLKGKQRYRRKNDAFLRQGEWFFLPLPNLSVDKSQVLENEPLSRGIGSKPHWAEFAWRTGGQTVYVCNRYPSGVSSKRYQSILSGNSKAKSWGWVSVQRNPGVYVRGKIRHPDHATIMLHGWHRVVMNTENQSSAMRHVAFLD